MSSKRIFHCGICLCLLLVVFSSRQTLWAFSLDTDDSVPAGFESLAGPRPMFVDIVFHDRVVGTSLVVVEGETLSFDEPEVVLAMLDSVEPVAELLDALSSPQPTHVDRLCYRPGDPVGCGTVEPNPFAVLFDEDSLKVTLFVDPSLQRVRTDGASLYLNPPERRGSAILSYDFSANSFGGDAWEYDIRNESWFGYGQGYLRSILDYDSRQGDARLQSLALVHRLQDYEVLAGGYAFTAGPALSSFDVLGLRISSSLKTRIDPERARGSELTVLLDRRALVKLYVDGRLYSTQSLDAGHVAVDTSDLPDGSSEVEVRIADPVSGERTEYHRFTRSNLLPPRNETTMAFSVGVPRKRDAAKTLPRYHEVGVGSLRLARRWGKRTAVALGLSRLGKMHLLQPEFVLLDKHLTLQTSASVGAQGEFGLGVRGVWQRDSFAASMLGEWFEYGARSPAANVSKINEKAWLPKESGQLSLSLDSVFGRTSLGIYGSVRQENDGSKVFNSTSVGVRARHRLFERARLRSSVSAGLRLDRDIVTASIDLRVSFAGQSRVTSLLLGAAQTDSSKNSEEAQEHDLTRSSIGYETRWRSKREREVRFDGGLWANHTSTSTAFGIDAGIQHQTFSAEVQSQRREQYSVRGQKHHNTDTALQLSTQIVLDSAGAAFGGNDAVRSGFIVDVDGKPSDAKYDIVVNSARVGSGRVGTPAFVAMPSFARYEVQLQPESLLASTFEQEDFDATLYPGSILRLRTMARQRRLLIATVVDTKGDLLSGAVLQRDEGPIVIDATGLLQIEISDGERFQARRADGSMCELSVPAELGNEEVVVLDAPLVCQ